MKLLTTAIALLGLVTISGGAFGQSYSSPTDVSFTADLDGTTQYYMQMLPQGFDPAATHDLLIVLHGHGAPRTWYPTADDPHARATRETGAKYNMIFVSPDYRASTSWMGPAAEADVVQIIRDLKVKYKVGKVYLMGNSMGGTSTLTFTAIHPDLIAGAIAIIPTANLLEYRGFQDCIAASYGGTKQQIPLEYKKRSAEYWPEKFTMPVSIVTGAIDTIVPPASAMRFADVLQQMGRPVWAVSRPGVGHGCSAEDTVTAMEFVIKYTPGAAAQASGH